MKIEIELEEGVSLFTAQQLIKTMQLHYSSEVKRIQVIETIQSQINKS